MDYIFYNSISDKSFSFVLPLHNAVVNIMVVREERVATNMYSCRKLVTRVISVNLIGGSCVTSNLPGKGY